MKRALAVWFGLVFAAGAAEAVNIGVNIGYGGCGSYGSVSVGAPVYYARPVVYYPAPVVCRPVRPVYYNGCGSSRPVYYSNRGYYSRPGDVYYQSRRVAARPTYYYEQDCGRVVVRGKR
mgnify:CR=1 FL=1